MQKHGEQRTWYIVATIIAMNNATNDTNKTTRSQTSRSQIVCSELVKFINI